MSPGSGNGYKYTLSKPTYVNISITESLTLRSTRRKYMMKGTFDETEINNKPKQLANDRSIHHPLSKQFLLVRFYFFTLT